MEETNKNENHSTSRKTTMDPPSSMNLSAHILRCSSAPDMMSRDTESPRPCQRCGRIAILNQYQPYGPGNGEKSTLIINVCDTCLAHYIGKARALGSYLTSPRDLLTPRK